MALKPAMHNWMRPEPCDTALARLHSESNYDRYLDESADHLRASEQQPQSART